MRRWFLLGWLLFTPLVPQAEAQVQGPDAAANGASLVSVATLAPLAPRESAAMVAAAAAPAAPGDTIYEFILRDGSRVYGRVVSEDAERVVVQSTAGARVEIPRAQIERRRVAAGTARDGQFWGEDPNLSRLFFTSTARPLPKGEGYVSSFMLFFPFVAYGVTDRFTMAGGTPIIPEAIGRVFYLAPKYTVSQRERASYAVGALGFFSSRQEGSAGVLYGSGTWGTTDNAVTAGAGWGYASDGSTVDLSSKPVLVLGLERRVGRRTKLVSENWFAAGSSARFVSGGVRFIGDRISADLGLGTFGEGGCCVPLVNFVWNFGGGGRR